MKVATKLRVHIALIIATLVVLVWLGEQGFLTGGVLVMVAFSVIIALMTWIFYWSNQQCEKCGNYIYETAGDDWTKKPFTHLLLDGKCYGCEKIEEDKNLH